MKVIKLGNKNKVWWVGQHMECSACGHTIQLEPSDKHLPSLVFTENSVTYSCPVCVRDITIHNGETPLQVITEQTDIVQPTTDQNTTQIAPPASVENPRAARIGNKVSEGWSNPFAGTSWGSDRPPTSIGR